VEQKITEKQLELLSVFQEIEKLENSFSYFKKQVVDEIRSLEEIKPLIEERIKSLNIEDKGIREFDYNDVLGDLDSLIKESCNLNDDDRPHLALIYHKATFYDVNKELKLAQERMAIETKNFDDKISKLKERKEIMEKDIYFLLHRCEEVVNNEDLSKETPRPLCCKKTSGFPVLENQVEVAQSKEETDVKNNPISWKNKLEGLFIKEFHK